MTQKHKLLLALAGCCLLLTSVSLNSGIAAERTVLMELMAATW